MKIALYIYIYIFKLKCYNVGFFKDKSFSRSMQRNNILLITKCHSKQLPLICLINKVNEWFENRRVSRFVWSLQDSNYQELYFEKEFHTGGMNYLKKIDTFIMDINPITHYLKKRSIKSKSKFHIITGHQTVMG